MVDVFRIRRKFNKTQNRLNSTDLAQNYHVKRVEFKFLGELSLVISIDFSLKLSTLIVKYKKCSINTINIHCRYQLPIL